MNMDWDTIGPVVEAIREAAADHHPTIDGRHFVGRDPDDPAYTAAADQDLARLETKLDGLLACWRVQQEALAPAVPDTMHQMGMLAYLLAEEICGLDRACLLAVAINRLTKTEVQQS